MVEPHRTHPTIAGVLAFPTTCRTLWASSPLIAFPVLAHCPSHLADGFNMPERSLNLLILGPSDEPQWVRLVVQTIGDV